MLTTRNKSRPLFTVRIAAIVATAVLGSRDDPLRANDLAALNDEFSRASTLGNWSHVHVVEQWNADQLEVWDINGTRPGRMVLMPYTVSWFQDYRGPLVFKSVSGDFVITTRVTTTGRDGVSVPQSEFDLAGLMIRTPRNITPQTWTPGGENYVFWSLGRATTLPIRSQFELKTTTNSNSVLQFTNAPGDTATLQIARIDRYVIVLYQAPGQPWQVRARFDRPDMPASLQVGFVAYTDWTKVSIFAPFAHNSNVLNPPLPPGVNDPNPFIPFAPDVMAAFDYARFFRPQLPAELAGVDLTNASLVSDAALLAFLGDRPSCGPCDLNCDGSINPFDIQPFVNALMPSPPLTCSPCAADADGNGTVNAFDIQSFLNCLGD